MKKISTPASEQHYKNVNGQMRINKTKMTSASPMYIYATEMVSNYYSKLFLDKKTILTVSGSGDQVLNAYFFGANDVISFDLNKHSFFITDLKFTAVKILSYTEFLRFFGTMHNDGDFDYKLYKKVRLNINKDTKIFFDLIYRKNSYFGGDIMKSENHFRQRGDFSLKSAKIVNIYLKNETNYLKMRDDIKNKNLTFIQSDIANISKKIPSSKKKFDLINISNIINYLSASVKSNNPEKYILNLLILLGKNLKKGGKIIFYAYSLTTYPNGVSNGIPLASRKLFIEYLRKETNFIVEERKINGVRNKTMDKIILLEKK